MRLLFSDEISLVAKEVPFWRLVLSHWAKPVMGDGKSRAAGAFSGEIHRCSVVGRLKAHLTKGRQTMTTGIGST